MRRQITLRKPNVKFGIGHFDNKKQAIEKRNGSMFKLFVIKTIFKTHISCFAAPEKLFAKICFRADIAETQDSQCAVTGGNAFDWYYSYYVYTISEHVLRCNNNIKCNGLKKKDVILE